ncbi:HAD hydrolase-like protein [Methylobacterium sp. A54F]
MATARCAYGLIVLDFDGTLADSFPWFCSVLNGVADRYRFRRVEPDEIDALRHLSARAIVDRLGVPRWKLPFIARHMHRLAARDPNALRLFPAIDAMLDRLGECGVDLAVLSSNTEDNVRRALGPHHAARIRSYACGASVFGKARRLRALLRRTGFAPESVLCVGDEFRDAEAARAVGCDFGGVAWGYTAPGALRATIPEYFFEDPCEIAALFALEEPADGAPAEPRVTG